MDIDVDYKNLMDYADELISFKKNMTNLTNTINDELNNLGEVWRDIQYDKNKKVIQTITLNILTLLDNCQNRADFLNEKAYILKQYLEL